MNWNRFSNPSRRPNPEARSPLAVGRKPAKSQTTRIIDVVLIGPLMIWGGTEAAKAAKEPLGQKAGGALAIFGLTTIAYNGINYARIKKGEAC
jgi:hypothetical protein